MIDADALDTLLKDAQTVCKRNRDNFRFGVLNNIRENIAIMPTVGVWISVKDRLPDESRSVLVYCNNGYITNVHYSKKHQKFNMFDCFDDEDAKEYSAFDNVTHWMPLPEPPNEGEVG